MTLADFLLARLRDDEKTARECLQIGDQAWIGFVDHRGTHHYYGLSCARVRAEVRAKRQIVRLHADCDTGTGYCDHCGHGRAAGMGCATLAYLAVPYAAHPDYRPEWRP